MKKIINGKKYDTETAELVGNWDNELGESDFRNEERNLYRKKTGEFFEHGVGGGLSAFCNSNGNCSWGGQAITPLTIDEAKSWVEEYNNRQYETLFGAVEE